MNLAITRQRNLMQQAIQWYDEIKTIERHFGTEDPLIRLKIEMLEDLYAGVVTELAKLLIETIEPGMIPIQIDTSTNVKIRP